jgi:hypothetical protein
MRRRRLIRITRLGRGIRPPTWLYYVRFAIKRVA